MCQIPDNFLTADLVRHPRCNKPKFDLSTVHTVSKIWTHSRFMFIFERGDLNLAAHYLAERMHEPFQPFPFASVAVHNSVKDDFIERLRSRFHQVKPHVALHPNFERSLNELKLGGVKYVVADEENAPPFASPILVTDNVTHLFFSSSPSGVVTLKGFNTIREAQGIFGAETPPFSAVHIFDESITSVYALAAIVNCVQFYVNCFDVCTMPILPYYGMRQSRALLHDGYHMETLEIGGVWKIIAFPYTTTLVRQCDCVKGECTCSSKDKSCDVSLKKQTQILNILQIDEDEESQEKLN
ncbi:uncharacterized protein LOC132786985 [Drosophila nasuta]|uniref:uncharacterized protein LOC132786985 n=1 Tax=Drosophila nasuta TaxID=42062 RepID=UPI00295ED77B|nr:uncharacterized protein LOC132786985 [Drosophila nasuta]